MQVHFNEFAFNRKRIHACLIQVACLIEVATMTGFTVDVNTQCILYVRE